MKGRFCASVYARLCFALAAISLTTPVFSCAAAVYVLADNNSTAVIDPNSQAGMLHWDVEGQNQLQQQWFWYSIGNSPVRSIDTISAPSVVQTGNRELTTTYVNAGILSVSVDYLLTGGAIVGGMVTSGNLTADIGEAIKIVNLSGSTLPFHFYQYSYFNLLGANNDTVQLGKNLRGLYNEAVQQQDPMVVALTETVTTPGANHGEVAPLGATLAKLNGGGPVTLDDSAGPVGPGEVTWALQWDFNIEPGGSAIISKDKFLTIALIPEPSVSRMLAFGTVLLLARRRASRRGLQGAAVRTPFFDKR